MSVWTSTDESAVILEADENRAQVILQLYAGSDVFLGFGSAAVAGEGLKITSVMPVIVIDDYRAALSISVVCNAAGTANGGYEVGETIRSGVTYQDLASEVGGYLGYGYESADWNAEQVKEIDRYVQAGVRQFYYPPTASGLEAGFEWSFLRPSSSLSVVADQQIVDLPMDFSRIYGGLYFDANTHAQSIPIVSIGHLLELAQGSLQPQRPKIAAVRPKASNNLSYQRQELLLWPVPEKSYTLTYVYEAYAGKIDAIRRFPLGGAKYSELIVSSCLAVAEMRANDQRGIQWEQFVANLASAIPKDKKSGAQHYGYMGDPAISSVISRRNMNLQSYPITYKGDTW